MSPAPTRPQIRGKCACGMVRWTATQPPTQLDYCYCKTCQQLSGAPFIAWLGIKNDSLILPNQMYIRTSRDSPIAARGCCNLCGSNLFIQAHCYPETKFMAAGTMVDFPKKWTLPQVRVHLFVRSLPAWYTIPEDGVPRWQDWDDEFKASFPDVVKAWAADEAARTLPVISRTDTSGAKGTSPAAESAAEPIPRRS